LVFVQCSSFKIIKLLNLNRYWSHTVNCKSCNLAYKSLNVVEVMLQIISVASIGIVATTKQGVVSATTRNSMVVLAVLSFALSRWLAHFIYKNFRYHDYNHAFRWNLSPTLLCVYIYSEVIRKQSRYVFYWYLRGALEHLCG